MSKRTALTRDDLHIDEAPGGPIATTRGGAKVPELIARRIVHEIASGRLPPGTRLPAEQEMMSRYGVGRSSLREALRILEVQGILRIKTGVGGGPVVEADPSGFARMSTLHMQLSGTTLRDLLEVRSLLEPMMAWHIARSQHPATLDSLKRNVEAVETERATTDADYLARSGEFHRVLCCTSANPALNLYCSAAIDLYVSRIAGMHFPKNQRADIRRAHAEIYNAIADGEAEHARVLMVEHMAQLVRYAERRFASQLDQLMAWQ